MSVTRGPAGAYGPPGVSGAAFHPNKYSKRDYEMFARVLKDQKPPTTIDNKDPANITWAALVDAIAGVFKEDNPRFDHLTFVSRIHEHETT